MTGQTGRAESAQGAGRQRGLTMVEMLVALVILGFVMTLVGEVVFQVSQVARAADSVTRGSSARWSSGWSAGTLFANLLAPEEAGDDPVLTGSSRRVGGFSSQPLDGGDRGIERFELELRAAASGRNTELLSVTGAATRARQDPAVVAIFPGRAEFSFVDRSGETQLTWPPLARNQNDEQSLPQAVLVKDADTGSMLMWYGFQGESSKPKPVFNLLGGARQ